MTDVHAGSQAWAEGLLEALRQEGLEPTGVFDHIVRAARQIGFEHCAYGLRLALPFGERRVVMLSNYPRAWQDRYMDAGYLALDPTVRHGLRSATPMVWSDALFAEVPTFWNEAQAFGLRVGWSQSCFDGMGQVGMLSLSRSQGALCPAELAALEPRLRWLANVSHMALSSVLRRSTASGSTLLTSREREVMKWTADGKTSAEVGEILEITVNTVNFHVKRVIAKLQVANKTAAVVRAAVLGMLD